MGSREVRVKPILSFSEPIKQRVYFVEWTVGFFPYKFYNGPKLPQFDGDNYDH